jgi:predicted glycosyltransferase
MTRFKDFGEGKFSNTNVEPISFKLHDEEFFCTRAVQGRFLLDLIANSSEDSDASQSAKLISTFFDHVLVDESAERFENLLKDKDKIVTVETLSEIVAWLMSEYTNRPNQQPEDSSPGQ